MQGAVKERAQSSDKNSCLLAILVPDRISPDYAGTVSPHLRQ